MYPLLKKISAKFIKYLQKQFTISKENYYLYDGGFSNCHFRILNTKGTNKICTSHHKRLKLTAKKHSKLGKCIKILQKNTKK